MLIRRKPKAQLDQLLRDNIDQNLLYLTDQDARVRGGAHPQAHLWDNGINAAHELDRVLSLREEALASFSEKQIPPGQPLSTLEDVLVPLYFSHRYQTEAAVKMIGGFSYQYQSRGDGSPAMQVVPAKSQKEALKILLKTLDPEVLALPEAILDLVPPRVPGFERGREHFQIRTGFTLDPLAASEVSARQVLSLLLHPQRVGRMLEFAIRDPKMIHLEEYFDALEEAIWQQKVKRGLPSGDSTGGSGDVSGSTHGFSRPSRGWPPGKSACIFSNQAAGWLAEKSETGRTFSVQPVSNKTFYGRSGRIRQGCINHPARRIAHWHGM